MPLSTQPNPLRPDDPYGALIDIRRNPDERHSAMLNSQLILLLVSHIGDTAVLCEALAAARFALPAAAVTRASSCLITPTLPLDRTCGWGGRKEERAPSKR